MSLRNSYPLPRWIVQCSTWTIESPRYLSKNRFQSNSTVHILRCTWSQKWEPQKYKLIAKKYKCHLKKKRNRKKNDRTHQKLGSSWLEHTLQPLVMLYIKKVWKDYVWYVPSTNHLSRTHNKPETHQQIYNGVQKKKEKCIEAKSD
jgi:hypothetical protein